MRLPHNSRTCPKIRPKRPIMGQSHLSALHSGPFFAAPPTPLAPQGSAALNLWHSISYGGEPRGLITVK
jgi:hypothetical protein